MKTKLTHDQVIRVKGFPSYANKITVRTLEGYAADKTDLAERLERAKNLGHEIVWSYQEDSMLTADYEGKAAHLAEKAAEIDAAIELENDQLVEIEGRSYKVRVLGQQYSDPIRFLPYTPVGMDLVISTQVHENYGAHDWDGTGDCPQYWKAKGGEDYIVTEVPAGTDLDPILPIAALHFGYERNNDSYREYVLGVSMEDKGFQTESEKDQLEYESTIRFPAKRITLEELMEKHYSNKN